MAKYRVVRRVNAVSKEPYYVAEEKEYTFWPFFYWAEVYETRAYSLLETQRLLKAEIRDVNVIAEYDKYGEQV